MSLETQYAFLEWLLQAIEIALGPALVVAAVAFLARAWFNRAIDRDLETYKSKLAQEREMVVGQISLVQQKRAQVVSDLYRLIAKASVMIRDVVSAAQSTKKMKHTELMDALDAYQDAMFYFEETRIYLTDEISSQVEELRDVVQNVIVNSMVGSMEGFSPEKSSELLFEADREFKERWPRLEEALRIQFRRLVGIDKVDAKQVDGAD